MTEGFRDTAEGVGMDLKSLLVKGYTDSGTAQTHSRIKLGYSKDNRSLGYSENVVGIQIQQDYVIEMRD